MQSAAHAMPAGRPSGPRVTIIGQQTSWPFQPELLRATVLEVLAGEARLEAELSVVVVDDRQMHQLNRRHLNHDYPTDVLAFRISEPAEPLEGEVIINAQMAHHRAEEFGWTPADELLLYAIHGTLHLCGYDDHDPDRRRLMRQRERHYHPGENASRLAGRSDQEQPER
jgi:probable rRNA maturation factor